EVIDVNCLLSTDGYLYSGGSGYINQNTGVLAKWDIDDATLVWHSNAGVLRNPVIGNGTLMGQCIFEASDGAVWTCGSTSISYVARHDPATGAQTHEFGTLAASQLLDGGSGAVIVAHATATGGKYLRRLDASLSETHSYTT